jgi:hypothetical protein
MRILLSALLVLSLASSVGAGGKSGKGKVLLLRRSSCKFYAVGHASFVQKRKSKLKHGICEGGGGHGSGDGGEEEIIIPLGGQVDIGGLGGGGGFTIPLEPGIELPSVRNPRRQPTIGLDRSSKTKRKCTLSVCCVPSAKFECCARLLPVRWQFRLCEEFMANTCRVVEELRAWGLKRRKK